MYPRRQAAALEDIRYLRTGALFQQEERLLTQGGQGDPFQRRQRVALRQDGQQAVLRQRDSLEGGDGGETEEAAVHAALCNPRLDLGVVSQQQLVVDAGIVLLKGADDVGEPVGGHAGEYADADEARLDVMEVVHLRLKAAVLVAQALGQRQESGAVGGQGDAGAAALQERDVPLRLQVADHAADTGLRVVQDVGGPGEATVFHRFDEGQVFQKVYVHGGTLFHLILC